MRPERNIRFAVIGGGSWATALVHLLAEKEYQVQWWMRDAENIKHIKKEGKNKNYLPSLSLPHNQIKLYESLDKAINNTTHILLAVPAAFLNSVLEPLRFPLSQQQIWVSAIKGIELHTGKIISEYLSQHCKIPVENIAVLSGPSHAEEVAQKLPAYLTIGAKKPEIGKAMAGLLSTSYIQADTMQDVEGIEYAAVLKNIYAIASGIAAGLHLGDNFKAVLVTSAMRETHQLLQSWAPGKRELLHAVYLGDLLVTAYSDHSRNYTLGKIIGEGKSMDEAKAEMKMIAEGYFAIKPLRAKCGKAETEAPILEAVYQVLYNMVSPQNIFEALKAKLY